MGRPATGQLYPCPVKTRITEVQLVKWETLLRSHKTDTAKALRSLILLLISTEPNSKILRETVFRVTNGLKR